MSLSASNVAKLRFITSGESRRVDEYPYERAASGRWTVAKWRESRFWSSYADFEVEVLKPDGSPAHGKTLLSTLRETWAIELDGDRVRRAPMPTSAGAAVLAPAPTRRARGAAQQKSLEQTLWDAADRMRGNLEAAEYKHVILGLVFLKYVSDAFEQRRQFLVEATGDSGSDYYIPNPARRDEIIESRDEYTSHNVFWVPERARWNVLQSQAKQPNIGVLLDSAMDEIEKENPTLKGVLPKAYAACFVTASDVPPPMVSACTS